jgi:hypothetical protein
MWLINTENLNLELFTTQNVPQYAILSHTWDSEEVTFAEFHNIEQVRTKSGFSKIKKTCKLASENDIKYA